MFIYSCFICFSKSANPAVSYSTQTLFDFWFSSGWEITAGEGRTETTTVQYEGKRHKQINKQILCHRTRAWLGLGTDVHLLYLHLTQCWISADEDSISLQLELLFIPKSQDVTMSQPSQSVIHLWALKSQQIWWLHRHQCRGEVVRGNLRICSSCRRMEKMMTKESCADCV